MPDKQKKEDQTPETVVKSQGEKSGLVLHSIVVVLLALLVVALVTAGVFYFAVKNNINGLADILKPQIKDHPVLKYALPAEPTAQDPDAPENLTQKELVKKYDEYRAKVRALEESLADSDKTIGDLRAQAQSVIDTEASIAENEALLDKLKQEQAKIEADKKALSELIARGDTEGFKDYFQKVDKATAEAIYKELAQRDIRMEEKAALAKPFSDMEPANAAKVLEELFKKDRETLLDVFEGLKSSSAALIMDQMDARTAAEITKLLSDRKAR